jgi:hypothetical protein
MAARQVTTVASLANTLLCLTGERGTDIYALDTGGGNLRGLLVIDFLIPLNNDFACLRVNNIASGKTSDDTLAEIWQQAFLRRLIYPEAVNCAAIFFQNNTIMGNIY